MRVRWSVVSTHLGTPCRLVEGTSGEGTPAKGKDDRGRERKREAGRERERESGLHTSATLSLPDFSHTYPHERGNISMVQLLQRQSISPASSTEQVSRRECTLHLN